MCSWCSSYDAWPHLISQKFLLEKMWKRWIHVLSNCNESQEDPSLLYLSFCYDFSEKAGRCDSIIENDKKTTLPLYWKKFTIFNITYSPWGPSYFQHPITWSRSLHHRPIEPAWRNFGTTNACHHNHISSIITLIEIIKVHSYDIIYHTITSLGHF